MTTQRDRVTAVRVVQGQHWIKLPEIHDFEWDLLRRRFDTELRTGGWQLCGEPKEITEYDEANRLVLLRITARAEREADGLVGPPAGRDRFA